MISETGLVHASGSASLNETPWSNGLHFDPRSWIIRKAVNRIRKRNLNWIVGFFGMPGKGKSTSSFDFASGVAQELGLPFGTGNVHFAVKDFLRQINERPPRGTADILDDAETDANSQKWWTDAAFALSLVGSSSRYLGYLYVITAPDSDMLTSQFRSLFHIYFEVKRIDYDRKLVITKPQVPYRDSKSRTIRGKYPRAVIPRVGVSRVKEISFRLPPFADGPFNTWPEYEDKKNAYMTRLYVDLEDGLRGGRTPKSKAFREAVLQIKDNNPEWSQADIAKRLGITQARVSQILAGA